MALIKDKNGIYIKEESVSVDTRFSNEMQNNWFDIEDQSWWFKYRADVIEKVSSFFFSHDKLVIDIGGGNGYTTSYLHNKGYNVGLLEPSYQACLNGKKRDIPFIIYGSVEELDERYDQFMLLDVLEHIEDDDSFLDIIYDKTNNGGYLLVTVPAFMSLWNREDVITGHFRRYTKSQLHEKLLNHGFEVMFENYFFSFLYAPIKVIRVWLGELKKNKTISESANDVPKKEFLWGNSFVYRVLSFFEKWEIKRLLAGKRIPFGSSVIVVARKR